MKPPAFQFYADDFVSGTAVLSTEETGAYILLLCHQWNTGSVPKDEKLIRRIARVTQAFDLGLLLTKFTEETDGLKNQRLELERAKQIRFREKQSINGQNGGRPKTQPFPKPNPTHNPNESSPSPSPSPIDKTTKLTKDGKATASRFEKALGDQWCNDAGKWINRIKAEPPKTSRVIAEVESATKENRITTTPAQYAEQIWKEFRGAGGLLI